jgi:hypothetical protein
MQKVISPKELVEKVLEKYEKNDFYFSNLSKSKL